EVIVTTSIVEVRVTAFKVGIKKSEVELITTSRVGVLGVVESGVLMRLGGIPMLLGQVGLEGTVKSV
ncbi:1064_t:CDS:1, partial [Entrophospora sp. SA101]